MHFGNNIEKFGFEKSSWPLIEIIDNPDGSQIIYMGKSRVKDARENDNVWLVRKITINSKVGRQNIVTKQTADWNNAWDLRERLVYYLI